MVREVDALLSQAVMKALGPSLGPLVLPLVGQAGAAEKLVSLTGADANKPVAAAVLGSAGLTMEATSDLSLILFGAAVDTFATVTAASKEAAKHAQKVEDKRVEEEEPPLAPSTRKNPFGDAASLMRWGEAASPTWTPECFPNPFVFETDFPKALAVITELERRQVEASGARFELDEPPVDVPTPLDPVMLPGLHKGYGGVIKNQTARQILSARTFAMILNRLGSRDVQDPSEAEFVVSIGGKMVTRPEELVRSLQESGHDVYVKVLLVITNFGNGLCIKEDDGTWTNIPWALVLRSGHEDRNGRPTHCVLNHGAMHLAVDGPLIKCEVGHHIAIDGFCGWYQSENALFSWLDQMQMGPVYVGEDVVRAVRACGLYASAMNNCAAKLQLPIGGYGLMGVCLDSAAVLDLVLRGSSDVFPMMHVSRFRMHAIREARAILEKFRANSDDRVDAMQQVVEALVRLPADCGSAPGLALDAARRSLICMPKVFPFKIMEQTVAACRDIIREHEEQQQLGY